MQEGIKSCAVRPLCNILSIDGGGIRGILPAVILARLERDLREHFKDPGFSIVDCFDLVAGTSTGGLLAALLLFENPRQPGRPLLSAQEVLDLYLQRGGEIFRLEKRNPLWRTLREYYFGPRYSPVSLETIIDQTLGPEASLDGLLRPCLITAYEVERREAFFFRQHRTRHAALYEKAGYRESGARANFHLRDVCRATTAAPTYFPPQNATSRAHEVFNLVDGGLVANNPALCAYAEARTGLPHACGEGPGFVLRRPKAAEIHLFSLGTGTKADPFPVAQMPRWGKIQWITPTIDIMFSGVSQTVDYQLRQMFDAANVPGQYLRIDPSLRGADAALDNASERNRRNLHDITLAALEHDGDVKTAYAKILEYLKRGFPFEATTKTSTLLTSAEQASVWTENLGEH
ncbi:MAG: patatin-like phospholipase family protein [Verrucomicrobiae bacterium]|nr:patatin-like phospholipase family protein [Verrucomicrobiae bacterium]